MRVLLFWIVMVLATPVSAATLSFQADAMSRNAPLHLHPFEETLDAYEHSYRDAPGPAPLPVLRMTVQLPLVIALGWWLSLILPHPRRRNGRN